MRADATLIAIEMNPDFVRHLQQLPQRPAPARGGRLGGSRWTRSCGASAYTRADYIISGIPFSTIPAPVREQILRKTCDVLEPGGAFLVYQFSTRVLQDLKRVFGYVGRRFRAAERAAGASVHLPAAIA